MADDEIKRCPSRKRVLARKRNSDGVVVYLVRIDNDETPLEFSINWVPENELAPQFIEDYYRRFKIPQGRKLKVDKKNKKRRQKRCRGGVTQLLNCFGLCHRTSLMAKKSTIKNR